MHTEQTREMPNYADGKIYCIRNRKDSDKLVYVGSTTQTLANRMSQHRSAVAIHPEWKLYKLIAEVGVKEFHIELIVDFPCERREQLLAEEGRHIRINNTTVEGCNKRVEGQTPKEYYEANRTTVLQKQKTYSDNPVIKDKKKAYRKERNVALKDDIKVRNVEYYAANKAEQNARTKANYEKNKIRYLAQNKEYRKTHKAEISARMKTYYAKKQAEKIQMLVNGETKDVS